MASSQIPQSPRRKRPRAFPCHKTITGAVSTYRNPPAEFSAIGWPPENGLTCRANHRHNAIIAKIAKARTEKSVAGFLFGILESDGGRTSTPQLPTPPPGRRERAVVRTFTPLAGIRDHTAESIKSLEGFRIAWINEAQTLSARSLALLRPTIRAENSELWASWNPYNVPLPAGLLGHIRTQQLFCISRRPGD